MRNFPLMLLAILALTSCSGRKIDTDTRSPEAGSASSTDDKDKKIESLTSALSRAQSRIEEMDAKLSAISDKVDATRMAVDNVSNNKPLKTEAVGSAAHDAGAADELSIEEKPVEHAARAPVNKRMATGADAKALLRMDGAISEFTRAMAQFKTGKYADAELAFNHFSETYPEHILAGSAQFYAGESYFSMGEYKLAINEYGKVVSSFSSSPRTATAMVRLAQCYEASGNTSEAARTMALAHDLYEGNPSLDWPAPSKKKAELNTGPIEPTAPKSHTSIPAQLDDKIDELNEKTNH